MVAAKTAEAGFGEIEAFGGEMSDDPTAAERTAADGAHLEDAAGEFLFDHPRGEDGDAEVEEYHFLDGGDAGDLHGGEGFHAMILEEAADQLTAGAGAFVEDEGLGLDIRFSESVQFCPWVMAGIDKHQFILEEGVYLEMRVGIGFDADGEVDAVVAQQFEQVGHVAGFDDELEAFMIAAKLTKDGGKEILARGDGSTDAQSALAPAVELFEGVGDIVDGLHGSLDAGK